MPITFTQLTAFLAVARTGSVKGAAQQLFVTQPSISAALTALGRELGVPLTERAGRSVRLTAAGEAFVPFAADVIGLLEQGRRSSREAADVVAHQVRIAAVTTAAEYVVPPLLRRFADVQPETHLTLEVGNRDWVFQRVLDHDADIGIGGSPPDDGRLVGRPFLTNELAVIGPRDDDLAGSHPVPFSALAERTWLLREEGSGTRALVERLLSQHNLHPRTLTLGSNGAIKQGVRSGLGVSIQSRVAVALELETGLLAALPVRGLQTRHWYSLTTATGRPRAAVNAFLDFVASEASEVATAEAKGP